MPLPLGNHQHLLRPAQLVANSTSGGSRLPTLGVNAATCSSGALRADLQRSARDMQFAAMAAGTVTQYESRNGMWERHRFRIDADAVLHNLDPFAVAQDLACFAMYCYLVKGNKAGTIRGKISAVKWFHSVRGILLPSHHPFLTRVLSGIERATGAPVPKRGIFLSDIMALLPAARQAGGDTLSTWRGILLSFYMLLRSTEAWGNSGGRASDHAILVNGVHFFKAGALIPLALRHTADEVRVTIPSSKTDQLRKGCTVVLTAQRDSLVDPVRLVADIINGFPAAYLATAVLPSAVYPLLTVACPRRGLRVLSRDQASAMVKQMAVLRGQHPANYATHSMRAGGATTLAAAGLDHRLIQIAGRWRSDTYKTYIRDNIQDFTAISSALASTAVRALTVT